jgi:hypothetical protein
MKTIKLRAIDQNGGQRVDIEDYNIGDAWPEQIELFFQFLHAQGFVITYASFLEAFGDNIKDYEEAMKM